MNRIQKVHCFVEVAGIQPLLSREVSHFDTLLMYAGLYAGVTVELLPLSYILSPDVSCSNGGLAPGMVNKKSKDPFWHIHSGQKSTVQDQVLLLVQTSMKVVTAEAQEWLEIVQARNCRVQSSEGQADVLLSDRAAEGFIASSTV